MALILLVIHNNLHTTYKLKDNVHDTRCNNIQCSTKCFKRKTTNSRGPIFYWYTEQMHTLYFSMIKFDNIRSNFVYICSNFGRILPSIITFNGFFRSKGLLFSMNDRFSLNPGQVFPGGPRIKGLLWWKSYFSTM